jgi:hypothetical protein
MNENISGKRFYNGIAVDEKHLNEMGFILEQTNHLLFGSFEIGDASPREAKNGRSGFVVPSRKQSTASSIEPDR